MIHKHAVSDGNLTERLHGYCASFTGKNFMHVAQFRCKRNQNVAFGKPIRLMRYNTIQALSNISYSNFNLLSFKQLAEHGEQSWFGENWCFQIISHLNLRFKYKYTENILLSGHEDRHKPLTKGGYYLKSLVGVWQEML